MATVVVVVVVVVVYNMTDLIYLTAFTTEMTG